jgi:hypothetical protein
LATGLRLLDIFNGKSILFLKEWESSDVMRLFTDASGLLGFAAVFGSKWFAAARTDYFSWCTLQ